MIIIGLTGPSGSGKSSVSNFLNLKTINADSIARLVVEKGESCLQELCKLFGNDILNSDGSLNRKKLAEIAFSSKEKTDLLNKITHPFIIKKINSLIQSYALVGERAIILDAPQLFEANCEKFCDVVIGVIADENIRKERIIKRDNLSEKQAIKRIQAGKSNEFFIKNCDIIIENNKDFDTLLKKTKSALRDYKEITFENFI